MTKTKLILCIDCGHEFNPNEAAMLKPFEPLPNEPEKIAHCPKCFGTEIRIAKDCGE